jgi:hypothetical protein
MSTVGLWFNLAAAALLAFGGSSRLQACFCTVIEPICNDAKPLKGRDQAFFIDTAVEVTERPQARAVFNVREWFNGPLDRRVEVELWDGDCRSWFTVGVTYSAEAFRDGQGRWVTSWWLRNSPVDDVKDALKNSVRSDAASRWGDVCTAS